MDNKYIFTGFVNGVGWIYFKAYNGGSFTHDYSLEWAKKINDATPMSQEEFDSRSSGMRESVAETVTRHHPWAMGVLY